MNRRTALRAALCALAVALAGLALACAALGVSIVAPVGAPLAAKEAGPAPFAWDDRLNRTQTGNTCGAHAAMAAVYVATGALEDPAAIYEQLEAKLANGYVYPWGVARFLASRGLEARIFALGLLSDGATEAWLRARLEEGKPVILIIGTRKYLHYVTALGAVERGIALYDSLLEADMNGAEAGNMTVPAAELLGRFESASFRGVRVQLAITSGD